VAVTGVWWLPGPGGGTVVWGAHEGADCSGACALHGPSAHWARGMPLRWSFEEGRGGRMERLCPHGVWHADPDDMAFRRRRGLPRDWVWADSACRGCGCGCACEEPAESSLPF